MSDRRSLLWWRKTRRIERIRAGTALVPAVVSITPSTGDAAGGTAVVIATTDIPRATSAKVGGLAITSFLRIDSAHVSGVTAAHAAGAVDVTVTNADGTTTLAGAFTYAAAVTYRLLTEAGDALLSEASDNLRTE